MRCSQDTGLGPCIASEAVLEISEYVRMRCLKTVVRIGSVIRILTQAVVRPREDRAILPHLRMLGCQPLVLLRQSHTIGYVQDALDLRLRQLHLLNHCHMTQSLR